MPSPVPVEPQRSAMSEHTHVPAEQCLFEVQLTPQHGSVLEHAPQTPLDLQVCVPAQAPSLHTLLAPGVHSLQISSIWPSQSLSIPSPVPVGPHLSVVSAQTQLPAEHTLFEGQVTPQQATVLTHAPQRPLHLLQE